MILQVVQDHPSTGEVEITTSPGLSAWPLLLNGKCKVSERQSWKKRMPFLTMVPEILLLQRKAHTHMPPHIYRHSYICMKPMLLQIRRLVRINDDPASWNCSDSFNSFILCSVWVSNGWQIHCLIYIVVVTGHVGASSLSKLWSPVLLT